MRALWAPADTVPLLLRIVDHSTAREEEVSRPEHGWKQAPPCSVALACHALPSCGFYLS